MIKVKKGTRVVYGKGKGQILSASETFNGSQKVLADSPDWQFSFQADPAWLAQGNDSRQWVNHLYETGSLQVVEDIPTGWK